MKGGPAMQKKGTFLFQMRRRNSPVLITAGEEEQENAVALAENIWQESIEWDTFRVILALKGYNGQENYAIVRDWLDPDRCSTIRTCGSLKHGESVVFSTYEPAFGCRMEYSGNVFAVDRQQRKVLVLPDLSKGDSMQISEIAYADMLTVYDERGVYFDFGAFGGKSDLLIG